MYFAHTTAERDINMSMASLIAQIDGIFRRYLVRLPAAAVTRLYSNNRDIFLDSFVESRPAPVQVPDTALQTLWGIEFRTPLFNAAGMFKDGRGYELCARQGAGAWLAGTTTAIPRKGNLRAGAVKPFAPYPLSGAASNWQGLPNPGHTAVAERLASIQRHVDCPIGASLSADPGVESDVARKGLLKGLRDYEEAGVDFIEINESCPNTEDGSAGFEHMVERLEFVSKEFVQKRKRHLPLIVKFSTDTDPSQTPELLDVLLRLGFDGINFGNTSTQYSLHRTAIAAPELPLYDYFCSTFGGGVSGRPLKQASLQLVRTASEYLNSKAGHHEFHIIRTGGIETSADVEQSLDAGASLCQWYSGYFEAYSRRGDQVYAQILKELKQLTA